jgi:VCBS repeat-containing protein
MARVKEGFAPGSSGQAGIIAASTDPLAAAAPDQQSLDFAALAETANTATLAAAVPATATFQNGVNGYTGTFDTYVSENKPSTGFGSAKILSVDNDAPAGSGKDAEALIRFDNLFGTGAGQIPLGATIVSATLILQTTDAGGGATIHRLLQSFTAGSTWNSLVGGIQLGSEAVAAPDATLGAIPKGVTSIDVTASLQAWASGEANLGWVFMPASADNWGFYSAQGSIKPKLVVNYTTSAPPAAVDDTAITDEDAAVTVSVLANDSDPDNDPLAITGLTAPAHGTAIDNGDGTITYAPSANYNGGDSFTYMIGDGHGGTSTASVALTVTPVNDPPVAGDDAATTEEATAVNIAVLANDSDIDGDTLLVAAVGAAAHGTVTINPDNTVTYTPAAGFIGEDSFGYTIGDGFGGEAAASVSLTVNRVNHLPLAGDDIISLSEDQVLTVNLLANDSDPDNDTLTIVTAGDPLHGTVAIGANGDVTYTPDPNYFGADSFDYTISDGHNGTATATVTIAIAAENDAPLVAAPLIDRVVNLNQAFSFAVPAGSFTDPDGDPLTYQATLADGSALPAWLTFDPATATFTGLAASSATVDIAVTADDGHGGATSDTFALAAKGFFATVTPRLETAPVAGTWDTADDSAIWINPADHAQGAIIATDKDGVTGGMYVYDLEGNIVSTASTGKAFNNVDIRYGFHLGSATVELIGATNQSTNSIDFFTIDHTTRQLTQAGSFKTGIAGSYGFTMSHGHDGKFYAFVTTTAGTLKQFELNGSTGVVTGTAVRQIAVGSQAEGMVVDDETGALYVSEEGVGIWKYNVNPATGTDRVLIDGVAAGHLTADVEGLTIYYGSNGSGYLIASSQGSSTFAVYDRATSAYLGSFSVGATATIDKVTETDGIDVTNVPLGPGFSQGLLVVHDHYNQANQGTNFKLVAWDDLASAAGLIIDTAYNPYDGLIL